MQVAARFQNAAFLDDLLSVLNHPVASQQPDLKHFRPAASARSAAGAAFAGDAGAGGGPEAAVFLAMWFLALSVGVGLAQRRRLRLIQVRAATLLLLAPLLFAAFSGLRSPTAAAARTITRPVSAVVAGRAFGPGLKSTTTLAELNPLHNVLQPGAAEWNRLVLIENALALRQDQLIEMERQIKKLAITAASPSPAASPAAAPSAAARALPDLLARHDATSAAYKQALQDEYELYRQAALDPGLQQRLLAAAARVPQSGAGAAVAYDIQVVQTQLSQESAIDAAAAKLGAIGSLSGSQLAAIRRHQPFIIPVEAPVVQGFGPTDFSLEPPLIYNGTFYPHFHTGLDIDGPIDTPVHAAADGVVALATASKDGAGSLVGYGNYVVIAHPDGFFTLYGHLDSVAVHEGQLVHQGEIIGQEGSTGLSTGPHVHFEIRRGDEFLDPAPYLEGQIPS